jgi:DNA-binding NarL/FixJ family response regulator
VAAQKQIRLALVEDSAAFIQVIETIVGNTPGAVLVGVACDAADGVELVHRTEPDLLLLDLSLRQGTGLDVLREMADQTSRTAVIVVTNQPSPALKERCFSLGARAFLDKTTQLEELVALLEDPQLLQKIER